MDISKLTTLTVPISIKWDARAEEWVAEAKTFDIEERAMTQEGALSRIAGRIRDEFRDGFGAADDLRLTSQILSAKADVVVERFHRVDRTLAEFAAAKETEKRMQDGGYDCSIEVVPHGEVQSDD